MTAPSTASGLTPIAARERVEELDVLRGVALFGVFLMNMIGIAAAVMSTSQQRFSLPTAALDHTLYLLAGWWVEDKANTLFAFLFGLGFYLQLQRLSARGADFERIYVRRLAVLLAFGLVHQFFIFTWDILHLYALAGFALFALRKVSTRALLVGGLVLALFGRTVQEVLAEFAGLEDWHGWPDPYSEAVVLARQQLSEAGDYWGVFRNLLDYTWVDYILSGLLVGWLLYALGRFMLGAWVGRQGWLQHAAEHLPGFRRVMRVTLPTGLIAEGVAGILDFYGESGRLPEWEHWEFLASTVHLFSVPVLAIGYVCAIVVALHTPLGRKLFAPFAYAGRMALTNYVAQSGIIAIVLFGVGPGLALAGHIGTAALTAIVIVVYAAQVYLSRWWLGRFRYGPLEWVWRAFTYGRLPSFRLQPRQETSAPVS
jgi:uncharacterized protein